MPGGVSPEIGSPPDPREGARPITVPGDGIRFAGLRWGPTGVGPGLGRIVILLHGVQSAAVTASRTARALAADGWNAIALDMPGHGGTIWLDEGEDRERYARANVARLVGEAVGRLGAKPVLIGHSWGADIALAITVSRLPLERVVLIDPPAMTSGKAAELAATDVAELRPGDLAAALEVVRASGTILDPLDAIAKAEALATVPPLAVEAVYGAEGAWQPQVDARRWRALSDAPPLDLVAADPDAGGLISSSAIDELRSILGDERIHVLSGASHSPQRTDFGRLWPLLRSILS